MVIVFTMTATKIKIGKASFTRNSYVGEDFRNVVRGQVFAVSSSANMAVTTPGVVGKALVHKRYKTAPSTAPYGTTSHLAIVR